MGRVSNFKFMEIGVCGYITTLLFNGVIKHYGLSIHILETIRIFLPELFFLFIFLGWFVSFKYLQKIDILFWLWIICVFIFSLFNVPSISSILSAFRDLIEPFLLLLFLSTKKVTEKEKESIHSAVITIFILFIVVGLFFAITQRINGSVWTSTYFAGHPVWGVDGASGIRVTSGSFGFKVLGTTASAETFGFYNMLAIIIILFSSKCKNLIKGFCIVLAFVNIYCSGIKTAIIVSILICYLAFMDKYGGNVKFIIKVGSIALILGLFYYMSFVLTDWQDSSFFQRIELWKTLATGNNWINIFLPNSLFFFSQKAGNTGIISFWDNSFLYLMFSIGLIGLLLSLKLIYSKIKEIIKYSNNRINECSAIAISLVLCSLSTCLFLGRNYIAVAFIIIGYNNSLSKN